MTESGQWMVLLRALASLGFVIALIYGLAWFVKKYLRPDRWAASAGGEIKIIQSFSIDPKKKLLIVEVRSQQILLGISEQQISNLGTLSHLSAFNSEVKLA